MPVAAVTGLGPLYKRDVLKNENRFSQANQIATRFRTTLSKAETVTCPDLRTVKVTPAKIKHLR